MPKAIVGLPAPELQVDRLMEKVVLFTIENLKVCLIRRIAHPGRIRFEAGNRRIEGQWESFRVR